MRSTEENSCSFPLTHVGEDQTLSLSAGRVTLRPGSTSVLMKYIILSLGTLGDTLPFLAIAKGLKARGHDVLVLANGYYRDLIEREGLECKEIISSRLFRRFLGQASLWRDADQVVVKNLPGILNVVCDRLHRRIRRYANPNDSIIVAQDYHFGARVAQETDGYRVATVHLQPMWLRSSRDPFKKPGWLPAAPFEFAEEVFDRFLDALVAGPVNAYRSKFGLAPVKRLMFSWWRSPDLVLCTFPEWLGPPQSDWPTTALATGFPFFVSSSPKAFDRTAVDQFLSEGAPPLVFTQSSVTHDASNFYTTAVDICRRLKMRGILLTSHREQIPSSLPPMVRHFPFVPMDYLLPRSALHVCHGGMGSVAWTLAAGIPQVNVPWGADQMDTSRRLKILGVARTIRPRRFTAARAARVIRRLLEDQAVAKRCRVLAERSAAENGVEKACDALERLQPVGAIRRDPGEKHVPADLRRSDTQKAPRREPTEGSPSFDVH